MNLKNCVLLINVTRGSTMHTTTKVPHFTLIYKDEKYTDK